MFPDMVMVGWLVGKVVCGELVVRADWMMRKCNFSVGLYTYERECATIK